MIIIIWADGYWEYAWKSTLSRPDFPWMTYRKVDIDKHLEYDLEEHEIKACLEALDG